MVKKDLIRGLNDQPITEKTADNFKISPYIESISDFIIHCETPITISLQGGWGTGKSSFMNLIVKELKPIKNLGEKMDGERNLDEKTNGIVTIKFNTWQYAQFNLDDRLGISFLTYVTKKLADNLRSVSEIKKKVDAALSILTRLSMSVAITKIGANVKDLKESDQELDAANVIETLREQLKTVVDEHLKYYNADRLVIFVDDLDRLNPTIAVNLLEIIKLFLDIENCVFVLAVDSRVIEEGIAEEKNFSPDKTKSFLDKMIQVPFKIPVETYNYQSFLQSKLVGLFNEGEDITNIQLLIQQSVGSNPRAMKRLINSYYLISKVNELTGKTREIIQNFEQKNNNTVLNQEVDPNTQINKMLLGIICMQLSYQPLYITFLHEPDERLNLLDMYDDQKSKEIYLKKVKELLEKHATLRIYDVKSVEDHLLDYIQFISIFRKVIKPNSSTDDTVITTEDVELLDTLLHLAEVTSESSTHFKKDNLYEEIDLNEYANNSKKYKLDPKEPLQVDWETELGENPPNSTKRKIIALIQKSIDSKEKILKFKNQQNLDDTGFPSIFTFALKDKSEWTQKQEQYTLFPVGPIEGEVIELGYHFSTRDGIILLNRVLNFVNSENHQKIKVRVTEELSVD